MLVASSFPNFQNAGTPRIISEVKKASPVKPRDSIRPRISSELLVLCATENRWWPRRVQVRAGQLFVGNASGDTLVKNFRIPLRHLSLAAGPLPNSLALYKGQNVILTLQTANEAAFDLWVKAIAIELIRQTPLDAVRYLDILTLQECWNRRKTQDCEKDCNFNCTTPRNTSHCDICTSKEETTVPESPKTCSPRRSRRPLSPPPSPPPVHYTPVSLLHKNISISTPSNDSIVPSSSPKKCEKNYQGNEVPVNGVQQGKTLILQHPSQTRYLRSSSLHQSYEIHHVFPSGNLSIWNTQQLKKNNAENKGNSFELLLKKCQNAESYVPVKEKLLLFETLCKLGREAISAEECSKNGLVMGKRAVSMHDLTNLPYSSPGVRQICKYFENKTDIADSKKFSSICRTNRRLINSDTQLHDTRKALNYIQYVKVT